MSLIALIAAGAVEAEMLDLAGQVIRREFGAASCHLDPLPDPAYAWDAQRGQYSSSLILRDLLPRRPRQARKICALTRKDLFIPMLSFIYGQAQVGGEAAIVSLARLRQEFYGLPANPALLAERASKEILHELGHAFGLVHCPLVACTMSLSTNLRQLDLKGGGFCAACRELLAERLPLSAEEEQ